VLEQQATRGRAQALHHSAGRRDLRNIENVPLEALMKSMPPPSKFGELSLGRPYALLLSVQKVGEASQRAPGAGEDNWHLVCTKQVEQEPEALARIQ